MKYTFDIIIMSGRLATDLFRTWSFAKDYLTLQFDSGLNELMSTEAHSVTVKQDRDHSLCCKVA